MENQQLRGYGTIRKCVEGYKIGPLFSESPSIARLLFEALCARVMSEGPVYLDTPNPNEDAQSMARDYHMIPKFEVIRMYRNGILPTNNDKNVYGITTFELG